MTQQDINRGLCFFEEQANRLGTLPGQIFMKANGFIDTLSREAKWSNKDAQLLTNLLILNGIFDYKGGFLHLTTKGYSILSGEELDTLLIYLKELVYNQKSPAERIFYLLWDVIGTHKDENPFYVDGKTFYDIAKRFISGIPPTYSKYTQSLHEKGESVSRIDWCFTLFKSLPDKEIPAFMDLLSDTINERIKKEAEVQEFDAMIQQVEQDLRPIDTSEMVTPEKQSKIFISHNSEDAEYAKALVNLLVSLGVDEEKDVFCSSIPGCGVKFGKSFIEEIREQYERYDLIMLFIHSPRYYNSHVSLCEMGAAWVMKNEHRSFLTYDCRFDLLDAVIPPTETAFKAGQENTYHLLNDFKEFIERKFGLTPKGIDRWETIKSDFISATTKGMVRNADNN